MRPKFNAAAREAAVVYALVGVVSAGLIALRAAQISPHYYSLSQHPVFDFESLYLTGQLALDGQLDCAYRAPCMSARETAAFGSVFFNHIALPPPYALLLAALAALPLPVAYIVFATATALAYFVTLRAIAGEHTKTILLLFFPTIFDTLLTGQSGLMTAAIVASACILLLRDSALAGAPIGLMMIKPHLAATIAATAACYRDWKTIAVALATALALSVICTVAFGTGVWPAFLEGVGETGKELLQGRWSPTMLISVYNTAVAWGASFDTARYVQFAAACIALAGVYLISRRARIADTAGFALVAATLISPYFFYYDFLLASVGVALLLPTIVESGTGRRNALFLFCAIASAWPLLQHQGPPRLTQVASAATVTTLSASLILLLAAIAIVSRTGAPLEADTA